LGLLARGRAFAWSLVAFASTTLAATPARGDSKSVADELFREGKRLLESGHVDDACPKLAESMKSDPALGTLLYLGACHEKQGLTASAFAEFSSASEWARRTNRSDRLQFAERHKAALEPKLSTLLIHAAMTAGIEVRVDDGAFASTLIGSPLPLDPGEHKIEAKAPGHVSWSTSITVPPDHAAVTVTVPPLEPERIAAAGGDAPEETTEPEEEQAPTPPSSTPPSGAAPPESRVLLWSAAGLGSAGILVGTVLGVMTFSARDSARSECPNNQCVPGGLDEIARARTYATLSTVAFGAGLAGAITTGYLLIRGGSHTSRDPAATARFPTLVPTISTRQAGLSLLGRFE